MEQTVKNRGWVVAFSGMGINLALGILYAWSIFKVAIEKSINAGGEGAFAWDLAQLNDPYSICCLVFAFSMILAGKCQDKFGPRITAFLGGLLVGSGLLWISQTTDYLSWVLGFGVLAGAGIGFGYSSATPPALKWFHSSKTGLVAGIVVAGFGLAPVYIAPLSEYFLNNYGISRSLMIFGFAFIAVVCGLALMLINPPAGYVPQAAAAAGGNKAAAPGQQVNVHYKDMMKMTSFWKLWLVYFIGSGAGLMVISSVAGMAKKSMGQAAFVAVAIMAVGNAAGRVVAGLASDRFGRVQTLTAFHVSQAILMLCAIPLVGAAQSASAVLMLLLATFIGFSYGANLALFPSFSKDRYGLKAFGINYGILFTAWGVGGFVLSRLSQMLTATTGSFTSSFMIAAVLLGVSAMVAITLKPAPAAVLEPARADVMFQPELGLTMADGGEKVEKDAGSDGKKS